MNILGGMKKFVNIYIKNGGRGGRWSPFLESFHCFRVFFKVKVKNGDIPNLLKFEHCLYA